MSLMMLMQVLGKVAGVPLSVIVSPSFLNESDASCPYTSSSLTGTGSGGAGGYTYAWDWQSGGTSIAIDNPSSQSTTLTIIGSGVKTGILRCTVTDTDTNTATDIASITLECGA